MLTADIAKNRAAAEQADRLRRMMIKRDLTRIADGVDRIEQLVKSLSAGKEG